MLSANATIGIGLILAALVIGVVAIYTSLQNTKGPRERAFVRLNCLMALGSLVLAFALMFYLIDSPWRYAILLIYFIHLPIAIYRATTKRQLIRRMEELVAEHHQPMTG